MPRCLGLLFVLTLVFFCPLVFHYTHILYSDHSDLLAEHLPAKRFLVRSFHETGELPLWCPHEFAGMPFVHDIQVGMFYPPTWLLLLLPEQAVGAGMSWLVVLHVFLAGAFMLLYARSQDLGPYGAFVAAIGFMFAGKWMLHLLAAGHLITVGMAWLPLVLWCMERAIRRRSFLWATLAGVAFSLMVLGSHPQWTLYAGVFVAVWTVRAAWESAPGRERRKALFCWLGFGAWTAVVAVGLAAVQLLPTMEAAAHSNRAAGVGASDILQGGVQALIFLIGPALTAEPFNIAWEDRGGFGLIWLFAAAAAPMLCNGRARFQAWVCLGLFLFAFGGAVLFQPLPGFGLFRQPTRIFLIAGFPVALLAGHTTDWLFLPMSPETRARVLRLWQRLLVVACILIVGFAGRTLVTGKSLVFHPYWLTLPAGILLTMVLMRLTDRRQLPWALLLLIDLWGLAWPFVRVRPEEEVFPESRCVHYLTERRAELGRALDVDSKLRLQDTPFGAGAPVAMLRGLEPLRGYNPLDVKRYKEYLQFIAGQDKLLVPMDHPLTFPVINSFAVENNKLLDLLATRYLLQRSDLHVDSKVWKEVASDAQSSAYNYSLGGVRTLPGFTLYENREVFPRAYVVPKAMPLPERSQVLDALKANDFQKQVFLEDYVPEINDNAADVAFRPAAIREYRPNRVVVDLEPGSSGVLVLADIWYPGWTCQVDGQPTAIHRANFLFRGVVLPPAAREVAFTFAPESFYRGRWVSIASLLVVSVVGIVESMRLWRRRAVAS